MFHCLSGSTADEVWLKAAGLFRGSVQMTSQPSRAGDTWEFLRVWLGITNPLDRWVSSREPAINLAFALAEVVWIVRGRNDSEFLNFFNRELPKYAGTGPTYHGAYGYRLRTEFGLDQLERAYQALTSDSDSRQVVLQIWNPPLDLPKSNGEPSAPDIPCNICSMLKLRGGRLEWTQVMRSNDLHLGFVHNVVQFTYLQEILAGWLGVEVGSYFHYSDSLHVYDSALQRIQTHLPTEIPGNQDRLSFGKEFCMQMFCRLEELVVKIAYDDADTKHLETFWFALQIPESIRNIGIILLCEASRRRGEGHLTLGMLNRCGNATFRFLYKRWLGRLGQLNA